MDALQLSIVIPCYNNAAQALVAAKEIESFLQKSGLTYEVILVDDGSPETQRVATNDLPPHTTVLRYDKNCGKGHAVKIGMLAARGQCCLFTDSDLPYKLEAIHKMRMLVADRADAVVVGERRSYRSNGEKSNSWKRRIVSFVLTQVINRALVGRPADTQCGIKAFSEQAAKLIFTNIQCAGFAFDIEIFLLAKSLNIPIVSIPVELINQGPSSVHLLRDSWHVLCDALLIKWRLFRGAYQLGLGPEKVPALQEQDEFLEIDRTA